MCSFSAQQVLKNTNQHARKKTRAGNFINNCQAVVMATFSMAILQSVTFSACAHRQRFLARDFVPSLRRFTHGTKSFKDEDYGAPAADPDVPHQIYKGMLTKQVKAVKSFSFGTSLIGVGMQPILYEHMSAPESSLPLMVALYSAVGMFTFVTPFLIHFVTKKYVTDITFDPTTKQYEASVYRFFPTKRKITFKLEDISVPDVPGAFTTLCVKNIPLLCTPSDFLYPEHYVKFMGYDKPVDYQLSTSKEQNKDNTKS